MNESVFRYVLGRLSVLTDEELEKIDFDAGLSVIEESDLSPDDYNKLKTLFLNIQKQLPISHHGVLGMKWGVRRYQNKDGSLTPAGRQRLADEAAKQSIFGTASRFTVKTRDGELITAEPVKPLSKGTKIVNTLLGISDKDELGRRGDANYTLNNSKGEKIGELSLISKNAKTTYWDWITIDESHRGKGYATDIINDLFTKAKDAGYSKVEINALKKPRPLYERLGFTYTDTSKMSIMDRINGYEFGAKRMEYDLTKLKHSFDGSLAHHGILGMKWGVRRYQNKDGTLTPAGKKRYNRDVQRTSTQIGRTMATRKRQLAADKSDLEKLNSGKHLSVGLTKKRQDAYDKRDKAALERRIKDNEQKLANKAKKAAAKKKPSVKEMSDDELRKVVNRLQMERQYSQLSKSSVSKGKEYAQKVLKAGTTVAAVTSTALTIYNNAEKIKAIFEKKG